MTIKALVVDDVVFFRRMFSEVVAELPDFEVIGSAISGDAAMDKLKTTPVDVVFLDVYMPGMDGLETLTEIKKTYPKIIVVMMSALASREADIVVRSLGRGALDFIRKPDKPTFKENVQALRENISAVALVITARRAKVSQSTISRPAAQPVAAAKPDLSSHLSLPSPEKYKVVVIGISTGGPEALDRLIPKLPADFPLPILIVQHMPPKFTAFLARSLNNKSPLTVIESAGGEQLNKGTVYFAPGGSHLVVKRRGAGYVTQLNQDAPENSCRPAADTLFRSIASEYGHSGVLALVLTGMGADGTKGIATLKRGSCFCITQSEQSCVIYGMPRAVVDAGLSDIALDIDQIPQYLARSLQKMPARNE